jgi:hypothetical protein
MDGSSLYIVIGYHLMYQLNVIVIDISDNGHKAE